METAFSVGSFSRLYNEDCRPAGRIKKKERKNRLRDSRVEAGSNASTVTLRVVGGNEKGSLKSESPKGLGPENDCAG
jgi:hypothetical protein